jgi:hypothetical protein
VTAPRRPAAAAAAVVLVAGLSGCTSAPSPQSVSGVHVLVLQYRSDIAIRHVQLEVVNGSKHRVVVDSAALGGSGYSPALRWTDSDPARIDAGATVDLPAALTTASCASAPALSARLRLQDGSTRTVPVEDSHGTLAALHRADCFGATAADVATVSFSGFRPGTRSAEIVLAVRGGVHAASGLTVTRVLPTTLLSPEGGAESWSVGRRFTGDGEVGLTAVPTRCDLHAIAEDKIGSVLPVQVRLADGSSGTLDAVAPAALKNRILSWVVKTCGTG